MRSSAGTILAAVHTTNRSSNDLQRCHYILALTAIAIIVIQSKQLTKNMMGVNSVEESTHSFRHGS